ncbi:RICIN domain-containing protein [Lewinella sp. JB7]|uniref:RICIN domain-containing protein n=1 Tax=Lewinella sp. JB7 TaxID=2962887 RepID=UPI0020C9F2C4|nr:RICIN domain-containing protein [Lewinella sp. JB7]MCP9235263.1 RICIN domain-containing protein [Lewinella sp. JB7]
MQPSVIPKAYSCAIRRLLSGSFLALSVLLLGTAPVTAQPWDSGPYYLQNVQTGMVIDVKGGLKQRGTTVWPFSLNYSEAQVFHFDRTGVPEGFGDNVSYLKAHVRLGPAVYLSVKIPTPVNSPVGTAPSPGPLAPGINVPSVAQTPQVATDGSSSDRRNLLRPYLFTVEDKIEYTTPRFGNQPSHGAEARQIWRVTPVPNEVETYYLENAHFSGRFAVEPLDLRSGGTLVLGEFRGDDLQKWRILRAGANEPTNLRLTNFKYEVEFYWSTIKVWEWGNRYRFTGRLNWDSNNEPASLANQELVIRNNDGFTKTIDLSPDRTSHEFNFVLDDEPENEEYCFRVSYFSRWSVENWVRGDALCEVPDGSGSPPPSTGDVVSFASSLEANIPPTGNVIYLGRVDPGNNSRLLKVHVAGNSFTPYLVQFLPEGKTREDCGTPVGVRIAPGTDLTGDDLKTLYGNNTPKTPVFFGACKLNRSGGQLSTSRIPIQIDYIKD